LSNYVTHVNHVNLVDSRISDHVIEMYDGVNIKSHETYSYNAKWYMMPIRARKLIVLVMMKSMEPMVLNAGKFIILSFVTFSAL